jgi:hypothetical protein
VSVRPEPAQEGAEDDRRSVLRAAEQATRERLMAEASEPARPLCLGPVITHATGLRECLGTCGGRFDLAAHLPHAILACSPLGPVGRRYACARCRR